MMRTMKRGNLSPMLHSILLLVFVGIGWPVFGANQVLGLAGTWRFRLDRADEGIAQRWFEQTLPDKVKLPGTLSAQGIGDEVTINTKWIGGIVDKSYFTAPEYEKYRQPGNLKVPFWLQPEKYYAGAAWYQRDFEVPKGWAGQRVVLSLERPHWETRVWVDDKLFGTNNALATPHDYDLGSLAPGRHTVTIRVDNRMVIDIGENSHSVSDHTQGNWNGIVGRIELQNTAPVWVENVQVYPNLTAWSVQIRMEFRNPSEETAEGKISVFVESAKGANPISVLPSSQNFNTAKDHIPVTLDISLGGSARLWDEFSPVLYNVRVRVRSYIRGRLFEDDWQTSFGLREISTDGTQFTINGRKMFIRGTLECAIFPKTGHPPTEVSEWTRVIGVAKAHGLNNIRFHSWCPPEAAFIAADELGFYLHVEASSWANSSTTIGDGKPVDQWVYDETDRILEYYGNHPSFILMPYGNEPGGPKHAAYLAQYVSHFKAKDPRRLWTSGAGWPQLPENQWHSTPDPRIQGWGEGLKSRINARPPETRTDYRDYISKRKVPVVSHEIGQWCVYPNFDEMKKYTGYLKPRNFEIFRDTLEAHRMGDLARKFLLASGKLQTLCYKEDIESALRTPGMGGFQLLDLHDFPGQGTALVGVLDPFWESKGYVTPKEYSRFCNSTVPLARMSKRVFTQDEETTIDFGVAHFGPAPLAKVWPVFRIVGDNGKVHIQGHSSVQDIEVGEQGSLAELRPILKTLPAPARYRLLCGLAHDPDGKKMICENDWDFWVYPPQVNTTASEGVTVVEELDDHALATLNAGGKVLLLVSPDRVKKDPKRGKIALGFSSIFWNTAWTGGQAPHTLGILCDPKHPALADFPTDYHSNWQWWYLVSRAGAMLLDDLPARLRPTVQVIDDWFTARKLGLVIEGRLGKGKLMVCSIDLKSGLDQNPVARQMLHTLLRYMGGKKFRPTVNLTADQVRGLMTEGTSLRKLGIRSVRASSAEPGFEAERALDGDVNTMWHSAWTGGVVGFPHEITIEFEQPRSVSGFKATPRQDNNPNGWIKDYAFQVSNDGTNWGEALAKGSFENNAMPKTVTLSKPTTARFVRIVALDGHAKGQWASLAELEILDSRQ